jgi:hypothetical protein
MLAEYLAMLENQYLVAVAKAQDAMTAGDRRLMRLYHAMAINPARTLMHHAQWEGDTEEYDLWEWRTDQAQEIAFAKGKVDGPKDPTKQEREKTLAPKAGDPDFDSLGFTADPT